MVDRNSFNPITVIFPNRINTRIAFLHACLPMCGESDFRGGILQRNSPTYNFLHTFFGELKSCNIFECNGLTVLDDVSLDFVDQFLLAVLKFDWKVGFGVLASASATVGLLENVYYFMISF